MSQEQKRGRLRWKRQPRSPGLRGIVEETMHHYTDGVQNYATVQSMKYRRTWCGWFWYGMGRNTAGEPVATVGEAKQQAQAYVKTQLAALSNATVPAEQQNKGDSQHG